MKKLLLLLILSFFSAQGFSGECPDGSEPTSSVSADGSYYVYKCDNNSNDDANNTSTSSNGKTICIETDAQERDGIIYLPNETKPFTGKNLCKYENGQKKSEGNFKDGKKDGKRTSWNENGQKEVEENFKDGKLIDETAYLYHENSQKHFEINFKDFKVDGKSTMWHENGQIAFEMNYKDGKEDGKVTKWYETGQIEAEAIYKDGECISGDCDYFKKDL